MKSIYAIGFLIVLVSAASAASPVPAAETLHAAAASSIAAATKHDTKASDQNVQFADIQCKDRLGEVILGARTPDPGPIRIALATIMTLGINIMAYRTCKTYHAAHAVQNSRK